MPIIIRDGGVGWNGGETLDCNVYRGQDGNIDYNSVVAAMTAAGQVSIPSQDLPPGTIWNYVRRSVSECDLESADSDRCIVAIDGDGEMLLDAPNAPLHLAIEQAAGAKLRLRWLYVAAGQEIAPSGFNVYVDSGSGFDFDTPLAVVEYRGQRVMSWTSDALSDGVRYTFVVRAYRAGGGEERNTTSVTAIADSSGPSAISGLRTSCEVVA